ncbi:hypothetical protein V6N13_108408 [Hibiscus sabdariffa]|uniref:BED-type domain-containing protein n=1 Tax=Hibiscus sabdariffa TaxID=183260 RepID=A0ABR2SSH6_9ROSI
MTDWSSSLTSHDSLSHTLKSRSMTSRNPPQPPSQSENMPSSFDENEGSGSIFIDLKVDEFDEEEMQPSKRKKNKKNDPTTSDTTLGKRKKMSKWWTQFSIDKEDTVYASCKYCQYRIGCSTKNGTTPLGISKPHL